MELMPEPVFRARVQRTLDTVSRALDEVDPDLAECELKPGQLTIVFSDKTKCILSTQPSVRQLWLAVASRGVALHFGLEPGSDRWLDDKGRGIELVGYLQSYLQEMIGSGFNLPPDAK